jgi:hypothetical protein
MNALPSGDAVASEDARVNFHLQVERAVKAAAKWTCAALHLAELCDRERRLQPKSQAAHLGRRSQ